MTKSTGFEFVDQIEFGRFLVILWRFSLFTKFQIIVVLVVKWGVWAISGKIAIKLPKIAQIQFGQRIQIRLTLPFPKMIDFLKFGQFWVIRLLNKSTELVGYSPFKSFFYWTFYGLVEFLVLDFEGHSIHYHLLKWR